MKVSIVNQTGQLVNFLWTAVDEQTVEITMVGSAGTSVQLGLAGRATLSCGKTAVLIELVKVTAPKAE